MLKFTVFLIMKCLNSRYRWICLKHVGSFEFFQIKKEFFKLKKYIKNYKNQVEITKFISFK